jgi:hypothetical protein
VNDEACDENVFEGKDIDVETCASSRITRVEIEGKIRDNERENCVNDETSVRTTYRAKHCPKDEREE